MLCGAAAAAACCLQAEGELIMLLGAILPIMLPSGCMLLCRPMWLGRNISTISAGFEVFVCFFVTNCHYAAGIHSGVVCASVCMPAVATDAWPSKHLECGQ
jgi:hypothetical protein